MTDLVEYIVAELKSKRLSKTSALALVRQFAARTAAGAGSVLHPLLHFNTSNLSEQRYTSVFDGREFFLRDHRVQGSAVLPAVAYLEMVRVAMAKALPDFPERSAIELRNVVWAHPLVVNEGREVTLTLFPEGTEQLEYEIHSTSSSGEEVVHSQGSATLVESAPAKLSVDDLKARMHRDRMAAQSIYAAYEKMGVSYGATHQAINVIHRGHRELLAELRLPAAAQSTFGDYHLHPSLLDAALQSPLGFVDDIDSAPERPLLPFALDYMHVVSACTQEMYAWVRYAADAAAEDKLTKLDVDLCDRDGNICVQMRGLTFRELSAQSVAPLIPATVYATPVWKREEPSLSGAVRPAITQRHIVLCGLTQVSVEEIQAQAASSGSVLRVESREGIAENYLETALHCFERIRQILQERSSDRVLLQIVVADSTEHALLLGLSGLLRTASIENPRLIGQIILTSRSIGTEQLLSQLKSEQARAQARVVRYSQGAAEVLQLQELDIAEQPAPVAFKDEGVYLITGGLGGLGVLFAREILSQATSAKVILTGRSALSAEKRRTLESLGAGRGGTVEYELLDVTDAGQVQQLIQRIVSEKGQLNGIIHAAGMTCDNFILKKTREEISRVLQPKVAGTVNLDEASREIDLDFLVLFSSAAAVMGNAGQADYAAANGFLDQFASYRNRLVAQKQRRGKTISINWPLWRDGGMTVDAETLENMRRVSGMHPMQTATGLQGFHRSLVLQRDQVLLVEGEETKLRRVLFAAESVESQIVSADARTEAAPANASGLEERTQEFLKQSLSVVLRYPVNRIDAQAPFERYGIDSIMAMNLTNQLEKTFGSLSKTLLFEYRSLAELARYFVQAHPAKLVEMFGGSNEKQSATQGAVTPAPENLAAVSRRSRSGRPPRFAMPARKPAPSIHDDPIAIVGLSGRYPGALDVQGYWHNLRDGKDCITEVPRERWDWREFYSSNRGEPGHHYSKWGGFIEGVDEFDPRFFGVSPREAAFIDPQERLFLQHAWMALEDAGETRASLQRLHEQDQPGQAGVYVGVMYSEYQLFGAEALARHRRLAVPGSYASIANRVSYLLDLHGPSMTVDTMCSSSLTAIHLACQDLMLGRTDLAIAGGVNVSIHPAKYLVISAAQFISSDGHCQSFGVGGDGYIPAEGVGIVVLKRLSDARRDGNPIYATIRGSAINHGGKTNGYSVPNPQAQASAITRALAQSQVDPRHISYIEAHGTGTKLGDPIEIAALCQAFASATRDKGFCLIGSAKSNIGHAESAAGIAGLTKVLLQMKHRQIAPSLHSSVLNPHIDFEQTPFVVNHALRSWEQPVIDGQRMPRIAGVSSFGAGGSNAHLVLQEYAPDAAEGHFATAGVIIPLSARTAEQLKQKARDLLQFLRAADEHMDLAAMAYSLQVGREAMDFRAGLIVHSTRDLIEKLQAWCDDDADAAQVYQGQVKYDKDPLAVLNSDRDFLQTVQRWMAQGKLSNLVELWVNGLQLNWSQMYGDAKPKRISLPTYPFAKERYWIERVVEAQPETVAAHASPPLVAEAVKIKDQTSRRLVQLRDLDTVRALPAASVAPERSIRAEAKITSASAESLLEQLRITLAEALYLAPSEIDAGKPFIDLGLDSIVGVEWVKVINKLFGLEIQAVRIYDYPNLRELASFVAKELAERALAPADSAPAVAASVVPANQSVTPRAAVTLTNLQDVREIANTSVAVEVISSNAEPPVPVARASTAVRGYSAEELQEQLRVTLAEALYLSPAEIDIGKPFIDLGLDSIVGVEWVRVINKQYGLELPATRIYDYPTIRQLAALLAEEIERTPATPPVLDPKAHVSDPVPQAASRASGKIAIVGISGRYPGANNLRQYWANLREGRNCITEVPPSRWDVSRYYDPDPKQPGKIYCKWIGMLDDIDCFDPLFFQVTPAEAELMDPQHRLFLQESYRAFEDAGYPSHALSNIKCGVYMGIMSNEYALLTYGAAASSSVPVTGNSFAIGAARTAYFLNLKGPAIPIDTACSSSLVAIHLACRGLIDGETDMALAGGVTLYLLPESYLGMCQAGMLSPQGQCKAFDDSANGFVPGEGVGALVLKRLEDAEADNDRIYGVIVASGLNQDGRTNGITAPSVNSQIQLERDLYAANRIDPETISYVETHGTGTKLGDPIELEALSTVFKEKTAKRNYCALGSVKSNIGHTSAAAGVASVQKVLLSMQHRTLVPTLNVSKENTLFDFANSPFYISRNIQAWETAPGAPRRAAVSSFGFSGTNAHLVIEEYRPAARAALSMSNLDGDAAIVLSARTREQLKQRVCDLLEILDPSASEPSSASDIDLRALAYTLQVGKDAMKERLGFVVRSQGELVRKLRAYIETGSIEGAAQGRVATDARRVPEMFASEADMDSTVGQWMASGQLDQLLRLWVQGAQIDWKRLYAGKLPSRVALPTYPFAKERYWVRVEGKRADAVPVELAESSAQQRTHYTTEWRTVALEAANDRTPAGTTLVLDATDEIFAALSESGGGEKSIDRALVRVRFSRQFERLDANSFAIDPTNAAEFHELVKHLAAQGQLPRRVVHFAFAGASGDAAEQVSGALNHGLFALFHLCRALMKRGESSQSVQLLSVAAHDVNVRTALNEALAAFYKTLALENPRFQGKVATLPGELPSSTQAALILDELRDANAHQGEVRYSLRHEQQSLARRVKVLMPFTPQALDSTPMPIRQNGVYIVTGGLGGLGFIISEHLVRNYGARLLLLGRSVPSSAQREKLRRLQSHKTDVLYLQADVTKSEDVSLAVRAAKTHFSQINGVIHCAGTQHDAFVLKKTVEEMREVLGPKVHGAIHLDEATADEPLDLFVLFSSIAGVTGNVGQCDYAYGNHFLDSFADYRQHLRQEQRRHGKTLSINWPYWEEGGMALSRDDIGRMRDKLGLSPLPAAEGIQYWNDFIRCDLRQGIALYGDATKIKAHFEALPVTPKRAETAMTDAADSAALMDKTQAYLQAVVGEHIKLAPERIDVQERFEAFGIDSIVINHINTRFERDFGELPKTLMYEHETVAELAKYLISEQRPSLLRLFGTADQKDASAAPADIERAQIERSSQDTNPPRTTRHEQCEPIAIIGHHGVYPGSPDLRQFWDNLREGKDLVGLVPSSRWDSEALYDPDPAQAAHGKIYCKWGGFLEDFDRFDAGFFNISAAEAAQIDPQERLFLQSVWSAFEDAGYTRERLKRLHPRAGSPKAKSASVGVFVGVTTNSYQLLGPGESGQGNVVNPTSLPWSIANRVSYFFDFQGPSMPIDTACSSALVAIDMACESLRRGDCQVAVAGGVNLYLHPSKYQSFCQRRMVSIDGKTRSFGAGEEGFVPAEGIGALVLKPLAQAEADGDRILAVIRASGYQHSGRSNGYSAPNPNSQADLISRTLGRAGISADTIGYVEGHGTGTQLGDSLEILALSNAFQKHTQAKQFCAVGSVKSNMGHAEAAAGVAGVSKILLQFEHQVLAPTLHSEQPNPAIDFAASPFYLQHALTKWEPSASHPRRALISSFGSGGVAACVLLEEYKPVARTVPTPNTSGPYLFVLSAKNAERLREYAGAMRAFIAQQAQLDLAQLCYTLQTGREPMAERLAIVAADRAELLERLGHFDQDATGYGIYRNGTSASRSNEAGPLERGGDTSDLHQLARRWAAGAKVEWESLHPHSPPRRIELPTYPFARERHWISDTSTRAPAPAMTERSSAVLHPLIAHNSSSLREVSFSSVLADTAYYAQEHQVNGQMLFPGSGFVEIAAASGNMVGEGKVRRLQDVVWVQPLSLQHGPKTIQISLKPIGDDAEYVITSYDDEYEKLVHSEGRLCFHDGAHEPVAEEKIAIHTLQAACSQRWDAEDYYARTERHGFQYGPAFRSLQELHVHPSYALSRLRLADHLRADFDQYILHPCLLDGALQTVAGLVDGLESGTPHIPFAIGEVEIIRRLPLACFVYVERADAQRRAPADVSKFNLKIVNERGDVAVRIRDFCVRALATPQTSGRQAPAHTAAHRQAHQGTTHG